MTHHLRTTTRRFQRKPRNGRPRLVERADGAIGAAMTGLLGGCTSPANSSPAADEAVVPKDPAAAWNSPQVRNVDHPSVMVAREGAPPLLHSLRRGDHARIVDATSGRQLADVIAAAPAIVNIEGRGVFIGEQHVAKGPLPLDHKYQILIELQGTQGWRTGIEVAPVRASRTTRSSTP